MPRMKRFSGMNRIGVLAVLLAALCMLHALAGTTGVLRGQVVDRATLRPIAGAVVTAESPQALAKTTTDGNGNYVFISLAPGLYTVSVEARGFEPVSVAEAPVQADRAQTLAISSYPHIKIVTDRGMGIWSRTTLVQRGNGSDLYTISDVFIGKYGKPSVPVRTNGDGLRFIPGVQAGSGLPVTHR